MDNINYKYLYKKYKTKYKNLKDSIVLQNGGDPIKTPQINLEQGMCVKGHYNPKYKERLTRIFEVCRKKDKKCIEVKQNNYITLIDGTSLDIDFFNKFYTVRPEGCPEKNTDLYNEAGVLKVHVNNEGFIFNVDDKLIPKVDSDRVNSDNAYFRAQYRIHEFYVDGDEIKIIIENIDNRERLEYSPSLLRNIFYIVEPEYNFTSYLLYNIEAMQKMFSIK